MLLKGKISIVIGAGGVIGSGVARGLVRDATHVVLASPLVGFIIGEVIDTKGGLHFD